MPPRRSRRRVISPRSGAVRGDLMRCRHRVSKLLLLHGRVYEGRAPGRRRTAGWPDNSRRARRDRARLPRHARRRRRPGWPQGPRSTSGSRGSRVRASVADRCAAALLPRHRHADRVRARSRGRRLPASERPAQLSLARTGAVAVTVRESRRQGAITKTGSSYARRLLVEAAWHYLRRAANRATLASRQAGQPAHLFRSRWRAQTGSIASTPACGDTANRPMSPPSPSPANSPVPWAAALATEPPQ